MAVLRALNAEGIARFRDYLALIRKGAAYEGSPALLFVEQFSQPLPGNLQIERRRFANRLELARYVTTVLNPLGRVSAADEGLWSWLALFWFDQLAPEEKDGRRRPREDYHYIPERRGWTANRHLVAAAWSIYRMHGETSRILLYPPPHEHGGFLYTLGHRQDLMTNRAVIAAVDRLYWDENAGRPKRGAGTASQPGSLRRLMTVLDQLEVNYDLYGMDADTIIEMLPREFR